MSVGSIEKIPVCMYSAHVLLTCTYICVFDVI